LKITPILVGNTGLEPVTSALSKQRSKPTELITPAVKTLLLFLAHAKIQQAAEKNQTRRGFLWKKNKAG
jgi:hypothetical protein